MCFLPSPDSQNQSCFCFNLESNRNDVFPDQAMPNQIHFLPPSQICFCFKRNRNKTMPGPDSTKGTFVFNEKRFAKPLCFHSPLSSIKPKNAKPLRFHNFLSPPETMGFGRWEFRSAKLYSYRKIEKTEKTVQIQRFCKFFLQRD